MSSHASVARNVAATPAFSAWRLWVLVPLLLLGACATLVARSGDRLIDALGHNPPSPDQFHVRRVEFAPGAMRIKVANPQRERLAIATVLVDDAVVPFHLEGGGARMGRLGRRTIVVPYHWVKNDPYTVGITSATGILTEHDVPAAVERAGVSTSGLVAGGLLGLLVGIVPVGLGMAWLPALRGARRELLIAFMSLTAGLLTFVGLDAFSEAIDLQSALPAAVGGPGIVILGIAASFLGMGFMQHRLAQRGGVSTEAIGDAGDGSEAAAQRSMRRATADVSPLLLATMVAIGIGMHNLGEGLAIGSSFAVGSLSLGIFLVIGFMIHNISEGLGIAVPASESGAGASWLRLLALTLVAGSPAIAGVWIGRYVTNEIVAVLFFSMAVGAAAHVVVEVVRHMRTLVPRGSSLVSGWSAGGFVAGIVVMYVTGAMVG